MDLKSKIRVIEDYPTEGISFKDITTLLKDRLAFRQTINELEEKLSGYEFDYIAGIESRGLSFGALYQSENQVNFQEKSKKFLMN